MQEFLSCHMSSHVTSHVDVICKMSTEIQVVPPWVGCPTLGKMSPNVPLWRVKCPTKSHLKKYFGPYFFRTVPNINIKETIILAGFVRISIKKKISETCLTFGHIFGTTPN